jgi:hypothetical protein
MAIVAKSLTKHFGSFTALDDVSIEVPAGSLTALLRELVMRRFSRCSPVPGLVTRT